MTELNFIKNVVRSLEDFYTALGDSQWIKPPLWKPAIRQFRHEEQHDCLLIYLKGIRWVSLLNASVALLEVGHVHEMGILCRCMDESLEDMVLFIRGLGPDGLPTDSQQRVREDFFQEQFEDSSSPMLTSNKRSRVGRNKIRAAIARLPENPVNPHDHAQIQGNIYDAFSGYVHGAYPHIMELYGGNPPQYHMSGLLGTPRIQEWQQQLVDYVYRAVLGCWFAAKRLGADDVAVTIFSLRKEMESIYPELEADPNELLNEMKKRTKN